MERELAVVVGSVFRFSEHRQTGAVCTGCGARGGSHRIGERCGQARIILGDQTFSGRPALNFCLGIMVPR